MNENREEDSFIRPQCCSRSLPPKLNVGSDDYVTFTNYKASSTARDIFFYRMGKAFICLGDLDREHLSSL